MSPPLASTADLRAIYTQLGPVGYKRACAYACWRAGDLSYGRHIVQERMRALVLNARARGILISVWNIARRVGKSQEAVRMASETCLNTKHRGGYFPYAAMTAETVAEFIEPHLIELAADAPPELKPEFFKGAWVFPSTEAKIKMRGCEDRKKANRLRGNAAIGGVVDEAAFIDVLDYVVRSVMIPQFATTGGWLLVCSSAPETPEHFFRTLAGDAEAVGAYIHAEMTDAPHLTPKVISEICTAMGGPQSAQWLREGRSLFVTDESRALVPEFNAEAEKEIVKAWPRPEHFDLYVVGDLGYTDLTVILLGYYDFANAMIVVEDEVVLRRPTSDVITTEVEKRLAERFPGHEPLVRAVDTTALTAADLRRLQPEIEGRDPDDPARWHTVANDELEASLNAARVTIARRKVRVNPRCTTTIAHLKHGVWNDRRTSFQRVKNDQGVHHFDGVAGFVYFNRTIRPNRNPEPPPPAPTFEQRVFGGEVARDPAREAKFRLAFGQRPERR